MSEIYRKNLVATLKKISDDWEYHSKDGRISCRLNREFELEFDLAEMTLSKYDEVTTLERQLAEAREALAIVYDPLCDITFVIENEIKSERLSSVGKSMLIGASEKIMNGARENKWFKDQLKEKG